MATQLALAGLSYVPGASLLLSAAATFPPWSPRSPSPSATAPTGAQTRAYTAQSRPTTRPPSNSGYAHPPPHSPPPSTPPAPTSPVPTSPPLRPLMLSTLRKRGSHAHAQSHSSCAGAGDQRPAHLHHHRSASTMELGTTCGGCGAHVAVEVPRWMLSAIEGAHTYSPPTQAHSFAPLDAVAARAAASGGWYTGPDDLAARAPAKHARRATFAPRIDWREAIVHGAIGTARTIKASPIPGLVLTFFRALFAFMLLLDARFGLHQRAGVVLARFFQGVVEIEKEVGVMRNAGEALSIGWEATVKGIIAFAKPEPAASAAPAPPQTTATIFTRQQHETPRPGPAFGHPETSYFPPFRTEHIHEASEPASRSPAAGGGLFGARQQQEVHRLLPAHSTGPSWMTTALDESLESPGLGVDYSQESSCNSSPPLSGSLAAQQHARPLRRTPLSSPALQTAYLSSDSAASTPQASGRDALGISSSASVARLSAQPISASSSEGFPGLSHSSSETFLPPYEGHPSSFAFASSRYTPGAALRSHATSGGRGGGGGGGGAGRLGLSHQRSRSGPGGGIGLDGLEFTVPPPSPAGSRGGWAGKAVLGLAERMKVI